MPKRVLTGLFALALPFGAVACRGPAALGLARASRR